MIGPKLTLTTTAIAAGLAATALLVAPAGAAEAPTRAEYVSAAELICKRNTAANQRQLSVARRLIRKNRLKPAGRRIIRVYRALVGTVRQLSRQPRPTEDAATLGRWIRQLKQQANYTRAISKALLGGNRFRASRLEVQRSGNARQANRTVLFFNFRACRVQP